MTPICDGVKPFLAILQTKSSTSADDVFIHDGGERLKGRALLEIPFPGACIRPMMKFLFLVI
eukprot:CAMPEP_0113459256 /NCGR_PEP_ID=MMETSP0014_2-20120614/10353_1 /TAXON_ID=2857 /ORGANISM="Nitzschia sp." /LENGTH=61 /DNA_ID=CAMNT_0000350823 /DNA_START=42 /DNA_END=227 /DNA_ORIENTATION=- /assembly_acc=CAM_ASM_000159